MPRALHPCTGCGLPTRGTGRCPPCKDKAEARRGTATERGYDTQHRTRFRAAVLAKHPVCQCTRNGQHDHGPTCTRESRHADHYPHDRRELVARGEDPNNPAHGRGLCHRCHSAETALLQPGGWNQHH